GRHLRLFRRDPGPDHSAIDRVAAIGADDSDLARALCRSAARLESDPGVLRDHRNPVAGRLDHTPAPGARPGSGATWGRLRARGQARRLQSGADHSAPYGADFFEPYHRDQFARDSGDDHQRNLTVVSGPGDPAAGDQLGRPAAGGAKYPDTGFGTLAADPGA